MGIDENGQIMQQGNSLDVGSSLWMNEFTVVWFVLLWEKPSLNARGAGPLIIKAVVPGAYACRATPTLCIVI